MNFWKKDPVKAVEELGGKFAANLDDYAAGRIGAHQIQCVLCGRAPCVCADPVRNADGMERQAAVRRAVN